MNCSLNGNNAQIIAKAIQSLSKFGSDLYVEADQKGFLLRSINSSKSVIGTCRFNRNFFNSYMVTKNDNYCKLSMKAVLTTFRNMKQVEQCDLKILPTQGKFQVQFSCRLETVRNALISIIDEENINATVSMTEKGNIIIGSHRMFSEISSNFNAIEEEITLEVHKDSVTVKNYIEGSRVHDKFMRSQLKLAPGEFEGYKIFQASTITFCLKEFRAFLTFAESINENLNLNFQDEGSPLILKIKKSDQIECMLIMSTVCPGDISINNDCRESEVTNITKSNLIQKSKHGSSDANNSPKARKSIANETTQSNDSTSFPLIGSKNTCTLSVQEARNDINTNTLQLEKTDLILSPRIFISSSANKAPVQQGMSDVVVTFVETEGSKAEDECISQSPERPQNVNTIRSIFSRCFESTYVPKEPTPDSQVFVPNSDAED